MLAIQIKGTDQFHCACGCEEEVDFEQMDREDAIRCEHCGNFIKELHSRKDMDECCLQCGEVWDTMLKLFIKKGQMGVVNQLNTKLDEIIALPDIIYVALESFTSSSSRSARNAVMTNISLSLLLTFFRSYAKIMIGKNKKTTKGAVERFLIKMILDHEEFKGNPF